MRKVGLLIVSLVLALGVIAAGYAMWSDDIVIKGTVNTGTVDINVEAYSGTEVYKIVESHGIFVTHYTMDAAGNKTYTPTLPTTGTLILISEAKAYQTTIGGAPQEDKVSMEFNNLFPVDLTPAGTAVYLKYCADFGGTYVGSIPVHVAADIKPVAVLDDEQKPLPIQWLDDLWDQKFVSVVVTVNGVVVGPNDVIQLHQGDHYNVALCIEIPQEIDGVNTQSWLSGQKGAFEATIIAYQWNETYQFNYP